MNSVMVVESKFRESFEKLVAKLLEAGYKVMGFSTYIVEGGMYPTYSAMLVKE